MINEEDFVVASLAKIVGQELHTIDTHTLQTKTGPVNKIDPKSFLTRRQPSHNNSNIVKHQGMMFHAGVDESLVQSMYPDPPTSVAPAQPATINYIQGPQQNVSTPATPTTPATPVTVIATNDMEKMFKSIDKSLKSIDKTQKLLLETLNNINLNIKSE